VRSSPVAADLNGDGRPEVVVGCSNGFVYAIHADGRNHISHGVASGPFYRTWCAVPPGVTWAEVLSSPAIDDLDGNGKIDIIVGSTGGVFRYELESELIRDEAHMPWPTFHHDNARTGFAGTMPALRYGSIVGRVTKNGVPVLRAQVHITFGDGTPVPEPYSNPPKPRSYVLTVGSSGTTQSNKGAYSINQLEAGLQYKLKVVSTGNPDKEIGPFTLSLGLNRADIAL